MTSPIKDAAELNNLHFGNGNGGRIERKACCTCGRLTGRVYKVIQRSDDVVYLCSTRCFAAYRRSLSPYPHLPPIH